LAIEESRFKIQATNVIPTMATSCLPGNAAWGGFAKKCQTAPKQQRLSTDRVADGSGRADKVDGWPVAGETKVQHHLRNQKSAGHFRDFAFLLLGVKK
jgi:hypothetical protein